MELFCLPLLESHIVVVSVHIYLYKSMLQHCDIMSLWCDVVKSCCLWSGLHLLERDRRQTEHLEAVSGRLEIYFPCIGRSCVSDALLFVNVFLYNLKDDWGFFLIESKCGCRNLVLLECYSCQNIPSDWTYKALMVVTLQSINSRKKDLLIILIQSTQIYR